MSNTKFNFKVDFPLNIYYSNDIQSIYPEFYYNRDNNTNNNNTDNNTDNNRDNNTTKDKELLILPENIYRLIQPIVSYYLINPNIPINPNNNYYIKDPLHPVNLIYIIDQLKLDHSEATSDSVSENSSLMKNISTDDIYIWNPTDNSYAPLGAIINHNLSHFKDPILIHSYENLNENSVDSIKTKSLLNSLKNIETQISKYNEEKGLNKKKTYVFTSITQIKKNYGFGSQ